MGDVGAASALEALASHQRCPKVAASMLESAERVSTMGELAALLSAIAILSPVLRINLSPLFDR